MNIDPISITLVILLVIIATLAILWLRAKVGEDFWRERAEHWQKEYAELHAWAQKEFSARAIDEGTFGNTGKTDLQRAEEILHANDRPEPSSHVHSIGRD